MEDKIFPTLILYGTSLELESTWEVPHSYMYYVLEHDMLCDNTGNSHVRYCISHLIYNMYSLVWREVPLGLHTQVCHGIRLLKPLQVLLLDEITVDLDVVTRMDLLDFFKEECEQVHI